MHDYALSHLTDEVLLRDLRTLVVQDRTTTAMLLAHIAEVDMRRLYVPAGYPSMHVYCVKELRLSDDAAFNRIRAARAARRFPTLFRAIADGELHLTAVCLLAPHLTPSNAEELIGAATHLRKSDIEEMLACRFPVQDVTLRACLIRALGPKLPDPSQTSPPELPLAQAGDDRLVPERVVADAKGPENDRLVPERVGTEANAAGDNPLVPERVNGILAAESPPSSVAAVPLQVAASRFLLRLTIEKATLEKLRYLQTLLSHVVPSGDLTKVLDRALDHAIAGLEKQRLGNAGRPKRERMKANPKLRAPKSPAKRHIPKRIRRAVWKRDRGQCTFVSADGRRCNSSDFLQFDHIDPVARGGKASVDGIRLRCSAHNQYEAERVFGREFMNKKREKARAAAKASSGLPDLRPSPIDPAPDSPG